MTRGTKTRTNHIWRQMVFAIAAAAALATAEATTAQTRLTGDDIERIARSVVRIDALRNGELVGTGSGTIIWPTGRIVTNRHVIENSEDWQIAILRDIDERPVPQYRASLQGYSEEVDIALLQIDRWADGKPLVSENLNLPTAVWAEWHLQRGDYVGLFGYWRTPNIHRLWLIAKRCAVRGTRADTWGMAREKGKRGGSDASGILATRASRNSGERPPETRERPFWSARTTT